LLVFDQFMWFNLAAFPYLSIPSLIVKMEVTGSSETAARRMYGGQQKRIQGFGGETWRKERPLGRRRYRWEDNI